MRKGMENFIVVVCRAVYTMHFFHQPFFLKYLFQSFSLIWKNYWKRMQNKFPCWFKLQAPTIYIQINRTLQQQVMHPYCRNNVDFFTLLFILLSSSKILNNLYKYTWIYYWSEMHMKWHKGQLDSEWLYEVINSPKMSTKI